MVTIKRDITSVNRTKGNKGRKYIVIHYTGNRTDSAKNNANYFRSVNRGVSAHYFVDASSIYQVVEENDTAWSVGVNYGKNNLFSKCKNNNSLNIEMCSYNGAIAAGTIKNTLDLVKMLMKKYNIPASNVVRHYDVCSKLCPGWTGWLPGNQSLWNSFKSQLSTNETQKPSQIIPSGSGTTIGFKVRVTTSALNIRSGPGVDYKLVGTIKDKGVYTIVSQSGTWGKLKSGAGWISLNYTKRL